jgi:hypothetical protein
MGLRQLPNNATLEELLKSIEESEDKNVVGITDDVLSFLSHFNILPGENLVLTSVVFDLYKNWSKDPISRAVFGLKINKHFFKHQKGNKIYYKINLDSFSVEKQTLIEIEKHKMDRTKYPSWQKHFQSFLDFHEIKKGKTWVQSFVLMYFYDKWCYKNRKKRLLSEVSFFNFCKLHFEHKRNAESRMMWFGINNEFVEKHLPPRKLLRLQQTREKQHGKRQKSKSKIPSTKTGT